MSVAFLLSLFGRSPGPFPVPVETWSAVERRRRQGRPPGRRGTRLALDGDEHGRTLPATAKIGTPSRARRAAVALGVLALAVTYGGPVAADEVRGEKIVRAAIDEASLRFGLPTSWIKAVLARESRGQADAVSLKGAMGLMQLMPSTWRDLSAELALGNDPFEPRANILAGAAYLRRMYDRYGSPGFLAAYNAGPARYDRYLAGVASLPTETRNYLRDLAPRLAEGSTQLVKHVAPDWRGSAIFIARGADLGAQGQVP